MLNKLANKNARVINILKCFRSTYVVSMDEYIEIKKMGTKKFSSDEQISMNLWSDLQWKCFLQRIKEI